MQKRKHEEDDLQEACVRWFRYQYPRLVCYSCPNGGKRNIREAARLKRQGVLAGVPDIFIAKPSRGYNGLYVEIKVGKNKPSEDQLTIASALIDAGYRVVFIWDKIEDFIFQVKNYFGELEA